MSMETALARIKDSSYQPQAIALEEEEDERHCHSPSSPTLPNDMLYEILTRVKLDDLQRRYRCVCSHWKTLTYDPTFKRLHRRNTQSVSGYLVQHLTKFDGYYTSYISLEASPSSISLNFIPERDIKIEAVSYQAQGLVCCKSNDYVKPPRYYICKPATQQWTQIPNPKTRYKTEKMAIVVKNSHPLHYKICRYSWTGKGLAYCYEIFDSKIWAWRSCVKPGCLLELGDEVLFQGSLHWLTTSDSIFALFALDIDKESWRLISLPQAKSFEEGKELESMNDDFRIHKQLVNCEGRIGLIYTTQSWIELWVLENYLQETWKKRYSLSLAPLNQLLDGTSYSILAMEAMDTMLVWSYNKLIWYNCTSGVPIHVKRIEEPTRYIEAFIVRPLNSDCEPCNNLQPREYPKGKSQASLSKT